VGEKSKNIEYMGLITLKVDQALTAETQTLELLRNAEEELTKVRGDLDKM
jgi:hypothetical protein